MHYKILTCARLPGNMHLVNTKEMCCKLNELVPSLILWPCLLIEIVQFLHPSFGNAFLVPLSQQSKAHYVFRCVVFPAVYSSPTAILYLQQNLSSSLLFPGA